MPALKPAILVALLFRSLDSLRMFDLAYVMTGGANKTETVSMLAYDVLIKRLDMGLGSAMSVLVFLMVLLVAFVFVKVLGASPEGAMRARSRSRSWRRASAMNVGAARMTRSDTQQPAATRCHQRAGDRTPTAPASPTFWQRRRATCRGRAVGIAVLILYCLFPFLWLVRLSMDPTASGKLLPRAVTFENYAAVFRNDEFMRAFMNSVIVVAGSATAIAMAIGGAAAYALGRLPVPGKQYILFVVLARVDVPGHLDRRPALRAVAQRSGCSTRRPGSCSRT